MSIVVAPSTAVGRSTFVEGLVAADRLTGLCEVSEVNGGWETGSLVPSSI